MHYVNGKEVHDVCSSDSDWDTEIRLGTSFFLITAHIN